LGAGDRVAWEVGAVRRAVAIGIYAMAFVSFSLAVAACWIVGHVQGSE
jgi:hypothetical protein